MTQRPEADEARRSEPLGTAVGQVVEAEAPTETRQGPPWCARKRLVLVVLACIAVNVYSAVLLRVTRARPSKFLTETLMTQEEGERYEETRAAGERWRPGVTPRAVALLVYLAVMEELIFRLFWLTLLFRALKRFRWPKPVSILLISAVWALGHTGVVEPPWVKLIQIFAIGLLLGYVYLRAGIEGAIATHLSLNLLGPLIISM